MMDAYPKIPEKFFSGDGEGMSLESLCSQEPGWAANQIRLLYGKIAELHRRSLGLKSSPPETRGMAEEDAGFKI